MEGGEGHNRKGEEDNPRKHRCTREPRSSAIKHGTEACPEIDTDYAHGSSLIGPGTEPVGENEAEGGDGRIEERVA